MQQSPVAAYVDGFNLYNGMHDARGRRALCSIFRKGGSPADGVVQVSASA